VLRSRRMGSGSSLARDREDCIDQSMINLNGWICGSKGELVIWIPQIHRASLYRPSNLWIAGGHPTQLDLSRFVHGPNWSTVISK
jgi:hypothetical protein